jgi:PAS domain S-box-containing protein
VRHALEDKQLRAERRRAEEQLRYQANLLANVSDAIVASDSQYRITAWNAAAEALYGWKAEEVLGRNGLEITHTEWPTVEAEAMRRTIAEAKHWRGEATQARRDGTRFPVEVSSIVLHDESGQITGYVSVNHDITERKQAEQALKDSEKRFQDIADNAQEFIWEVDAQGRGTYVSQVAEKILGYTPEEYLQKNVYDFFPPEDREAVKATVFAAFAAKQPFREFITRCVHKNGQTVWLSISALPVLDDKGNLLGYRGANTDITERKRAEDALRESEAKYRTLVENIPQKIFMKDRELNYLSTNENYARDLGIQPADIVGKTDYDFYPKDLAEKYRADDIRIMETAQLEELEEKYLQEGRETWIHTIKTPVRNENGEIVALLGIFYDITERRRGEEKLEEERILLRTLIDNLPDRIYVKDVQGHKIITNSADWLASGGKTMEDVIGKTDREVYPPELAEAYWAIDKAVMDSGISIVNREEPGLDSQGNPVQILTSKVPLRDGNGKIVGLVGIGRDITKRKQAELALQDSEQKYRLLVNNASEVIVVAQDGMLKFVNRMASDLTGLSEQELTSRPFSELIHPDDRAMVIERYLSRMKGDLTIPRYIFRLMARDGKIKWVEIGAVSIDWEGKPATLNFLTDITDRKQAELVREALYTISQAAVTGSLEDLYLTIHRALGNLMPVDNFYIALYDPDADLLSFPYSVDQHDASYSPHKPGRGLTEYILRTGRPLLVDRQAFTQLVQEGEVELVGADSVQWLGVPLKVDEKIFGVIAVQSYTESVPFSHANMEMLEFVSAQVTTVIERRLTQQRIADTLELNLTLINASSLGISAYDSSGQCILANEAIAKILGATRAQVLSQNYNHSESWKKSGLLEVAREAEASGKETRRENHTKSEFGKEIWLDCHFTPFVSNGEPHLLRIVEDISNAKQDEIALQAYAIKLEQSNRDLQEFAYVASHDLQEPRRKVQAFSDLMISEYGDALDETGRDYMKRMDSACQRMMTLITDLLSFARVSTRAQPFTEVDLNTVAQDVVSDLENQIESTQGRIEICKLPMIEADPTQMHQLLQNLISNALKFHHEGNSPLVKVSAKINGDACQISVEDNGISFDIQYLDRIFKPFERLHSREEYEGSGMGLAICRRIAERHGGKITAASASGKGATFIVTLPIHQSKGDRPHV